jgi:signal transduction histidine kinase
MNVAGFLSEEGLGIAGEVRRKLLRGEASDGPYDQRLTGRDGTEALMELNSSLVLRDGQPIGFQNVARDVTLEHRLQENLQFYIREVTRAQEEERKRLARELHDETAQRLIALSHHLEHIAVSNKRLSAETIGQLTNLQEGVRDVLKEVRRFSRDLRPSILDDLGLLPAMEWLTDNIREQHGIEADLMITGSQQRLNPEAELLLFRIAQEALNNVRRHAEASKVSVAIEFDEAKMRLTVQDDGKGFQVPNTVGELSRIGKLGLIGMEERMRLLGGSLRVQSEPCQGTTVTVEAPI